MADRIQQLNYKGGHCASCGTSVQDILERLGSVKRQFHFHHLDPSQKHPDYDNLIQRVVSSDQLDEIDKCVLLCVACHGAAETQKSKGSLTITVKAEGRETTQTLHGEYIHDFKDKKMSFITNDQFLAQPYWVCLGDAERQMVFGTELKASLLDDYMKRLGDLGRFAIWTWEDEFMLGVEDLGDGKGSMEYDIRCPFIEGSYSETKEKPPIVYTRNGSAVIRGSNDVERKGIMTVEFNLKSLITK